MQISELRSRPELATHASLLLLAIPVWFLVGAILDTYFGIRFLFMPFELMLSNPATRSVFNIVSPLVFLGSLGLVILLNLITVFDLRFSVRKLEISGQLSLRARLSNVLLLLSSTAIVTIMLAYAVVENFIILPR